MCGGWDELRGSLINDIGALNKVEVGEWSWCDRIDVEHRERPNATLDVYLDSLSRLVSSDGALEELQRSYQLTPDCTRPHSNLFGVLSDHGAGRLRGHRSGRCAADLPGGH